MTTLATTSLPLFKVSLLALLISNITQASVQNIDPSATATLETIKIEAMSELDPIKSYIDYKEANVTRNGLAKRDIPQTVDTIDVQKYKVYGSNDLSVMLQGTPGISTSYDMRGDGITIRGFNADTGDIYRDGIREGGQVRRSTSSVERIEILKGPASVLYGRSAGGGVVNMVSKYANFNSKSTLGIYAGSWNNLGTAIDLNHAVNDNWAVRLNSEYGEADSFRKGIHSRQVMASPSVTYRNDDHTLTWTTQYTFDNLHRIPDRGPYVYNLPQGTSTKQSYAQNGDFVDDTLHVARTDLKYEYAPNWNFHWALSYRVAEQNFDHFYLGTMCTSTVKATATNSGCYKDYIKQIYYWQNTKNTTTTNTFDITGEFNTGVIKHNIMLGADWTYEQREPQLANSNQNNSLIYGFVNPLTGDKFSSRGSGDLKLNTYNYNQATGLGFFLQDLISFNEQFKLMLGARYDSYESSTSNKLLASNNPNFKRTVDSESFSPNVGLIYQPNEHHSIYASYSKSFSPFGGSAGVNAVTSSQNLAVFNAEPQYNIQYEIGVKSDWLDNRLNTQISVYDIRKDNIRYRPDPTNNPDLWAVAGQHESKGVEFSFIGRLIDNVFVRGGYGYTDAKVTKDLQTPTNVNKRLALTSKNTGNLFVRYLPTESVYLETGVTYVGSFYNNLNNDYKVKGFSRLDAAIGYSQAPWNVTLAVGNVTNKKYWRSADLPGTPRSVLMRVNYQF
ncbi:iron complex outermembrane recepter protein [Acinetobacter boissieri]|uniref:Iron complex outermembrane recepter protein n=1 Tax=Acinetobacter boissieri TaxID=1219383 RepID=A0A1G6GRT2_9GAMM|nr:TonB-dependent siderophore receptor [Acinetobacter boissieri]SDB84752.1 iron complex outermembrane recepter protein [Acinetobacter boissieri]